MKTKIVKQRLKTPEGTYIHKERMSRSLGPIRVGQEPVGTETGTAFQWECREYYGLVEHHESGFPIGNGPWAMISLTATDESARHDWRDFQSIKNALVGEEWEAVELYPAESRLRDPSNRFYLWCAPLGVFVFGLPEGRLVMNADKAIAPQRAFPEV